MHFDKVVDASSSALDAKVFQSSEAQQGLFFRCQIDPNNPAYNISCSYKLQGLVDVAALEKSLCTISNRHETLRTRFRLESTGLIQLIVPPSIILQDSKAPSDSTSTNYLEKKVLPDLLPVSDLERLLNDEINKPFELNNSALYRNVLFSNSNGTQHVFVFIVHHLIFDHSSKSIFNYELSELYKHFAHTHPLQLEPLEHQFSDYVHLKNQKNQGTAIEKQQKYWLKKLAGLEPPSIPLDRARSAPPNSQGIRIEQELSDELVDSLKKISGEHHSTLFITTLAIAKVLISRWTGENDISLGTHYADRRFSGGDSMIGYLLNTLVLRSNLSECHTFSDLLHSVQKTCFQAYRYSDIPFEKLVESLIVDRNYKRNPFFDIRFTHLKDHEHNLELEELKVQNIDLEESRARYDLTLTLLERNNKYHIQIEYRPALFNRHKIEWLLEKYVELLETISSNPQILLKDLTLVDANIKDTLFNEFNRAPTPYPKEKAIHQLISEQALKTPRAVALRHLQNQKTFEELEADTNKLGHYLQSIGVAPGTVVAVSIDRSINMVIALLSVLKTGASYLPIDHHYPSDRIRHMLDDSNCEYIITESGIACLLPKTDAYLLQIDVDWKKITKGPNTSSTSNDTSNLTTISQIDTNSTAYIIYTSGSTGKPKGVLVTHKNVVNFLYSMRKLPGLSSGDNLLAVTTLSFDIAVLEIWLPLICGATTIIAASTVVADGKQLKLLLESTQANVMQATPISWRLLLEAGWSGGEHFKALCGGEAMPPDLALELHDKVGELWNMYGPTETTVWSSCCKITNPLEPIHIGTPIDNTAFHILNSNHQLVPPGAVGELFIGGDGVSAGYHKRPEMNHEKFITSPFNPTDRLYATGDAARFSPTGKIEFIARMDNQIKIRGLRIELEEIEAQINALPAIIQSIVVVREETPGDQRIVAYYESKENQSASNLSYSLKQTLPRYMIPQQWVHLDRLPLTPNGKLNRNALPAVSSGNNRLIDSRTATALPATKLEKDMARIWTDILHIDTVPLDATFFDLGGHSLLAMQVIARARQELDIEINPMSMASNSLHELVREFDPEDGAIDKSISTQSNNQLTTFFFNNNQLYARLDKPDQNQAIQGAVLLCNPLYIESNNIHWGYRRLATLLSAAGFYVLRFDYYGTGNSLGDDEEGNVTRWSKDVSAAASELLLQSGQSSLSIVGFRYGATLGSLLNEQALNTFVLWDPIVDSLDHVKSLERKYYTSVFEINEYATHKRVAKENELSGYIFPDKARRSIIDAELQLDKLMQKCKTVALVTNEKKEKYRSLLNRSNSIKTLNSDNSVQLPASDTPIGNAELADKQVNIAIIDDDLPSIESMIEPSIWLPGKSLNKIVELIASSHDG